MSTQVRSCCFHADSGFLWVCFESIRFAELIVLERQVQATIHFCPFPEGRTCPTNMFELFLRYAKLMMMGTCDWSTATGAAFKSVPGSEKESLAAWRDRGHEACSEPNNTSICIWVEGHKTKLLKASETPKLLLGWYQKIGTVSLLDCSHSWDFRADLLPHLKMSRINWVKDGKSAF